MFESLGERIVIIGNSGAGKSRLADALANLVRVPVIDLDLLHWEDGYGRKRNEDAARQMTLEVSNQPRWIIEGVFGWLAEVALPKATGLIWLDLPVSLCRAGLLAQTRVAQSQFRDLPIAAYGTFETCRRALRMSVDQGRPEVIG